MLKVKNCLLVVVAVFLSIGNMNAQELKRQGALKELLPGPASAADHDKWLDMMKQWRTNEKARVKYNDSRYLNPAMAWTQKVFIYAQMMAHDRYFYDPVSGKYTVDKYLDDLKKRYGGIDGVLIWPTYPNIGVDNRNQYDLVNDMPGGLPAIKQMVADFKKRGVRVFFPIMIWDHGTRKIKDAMPQTLVNEMKAIGADGMNGDTMNGVTGDFIKACDSIGYELAFQPEWAIKDVKMLEWNRMGWGYFWNYGYSPGVSLYKWFEPRHQISVTNRWVVNRNDDLQYAFFNGVGYNSWENIWGIWNQVSERDAAAIRRISAIYHQFPGIWNSAAWEPHIPVLQKGVYASVFPGTNQTVYTLINRDSTNKTGGQLKLDFKRGIQYFDLWNGNKLSPKLQGNQAVVSVPIEANGFGAILAISGKADKSFSQFLTSIHSMAKVSLSNLSVTWKPLPQQIVEIKKTRPASQAQADMQLIPAVKAYNFQSTGVMVEGDKLPQAVGLQHPWETHPARSQKHTMDIASFYIDKYPVTNEQFKKFMDATHYHPKDDHNFLKDWKNGSYPEKWDNKPVTWVSLEDARAYAAWAGKRLPHEWEWQYAAQGTDGRLYPWGNTREANRMPQPDTGRKMRPPTAVKKYPKGASPFGVMDMVGNVWQWTDEYVDEHTRNAVLKGCGYYHAQTSKWYFPEAYELNKYGKYLLMAPALDRAGTIGFRCVADAGE